MATHDRRACDGCDECDRLDKEQVPEKAYLATYVTDDSRARKSCNQVLLFGIIGDPKGESWKYVKLPCPNCGFAHEFKRESWNEDVDASFSKGYHSHGCDLHYIPPEQGE